MKSPLSTPPFGNTSRRSALQKLSGAALAGSAVATAGWPWPLRAAPAAAPQPQTPGPGSASPGAEPARAPGVRLVTVGGGITEVVYALGAQDLLVGTDSTSLYPPAAQATPKVGYMRQLSAEGLLALRPDALIAGTDAGPPVVLEQLRGAGVTVELIAADHSWGEVGRKAPPGAKPMRARCSSGSTRAGPPSPPACARPPAPRNPKCCSCSRTPAVPWSRANRPPPTR